ncbi:hypothetical protein [Tahibacter harae]|uniref:EF-hand domain-containing protein n=1 Tax=Tahibacter harae TaxID=2963937 RepID=A0ABT1QYZ3_9GAMM|nr:hypothetical protein [Tahibacter harae]MCQ4167507.1 hypothetical protein [Tahibacter harae]
MKALSVLILCTLAGAAAAQADRSGDNLREIRFADPRGDLIVRYGQPPPRPAEARPAFAALDRNGDGAIDEIEARAYLTLANDFDYADSNNDRRISAREFQRW